MIKIKDQLKKELLELKDGYCLDSIDDFRCNFPIINSIVNFNPQSYSEDFIKQAANDAIQFLTSENNNTIYEKKSELDQFYTNEIIAKQCYNEIFNIYKEVDFELFLEPSAGSGSFFNLFPKNRLGLDLDPKNDKILKQDFFKFTPPQNKKIITIGNPPFGKNASLAVKFFNKAAEFSEVIAFIVPKTFQKDSLHNKLNLQFKLKLNTDLPKNSFVLNGQPYNVPCCFQIWQKFKIPRVIKKVDLNNEYFYFSDKLNSDIAVRRVGGRAGKATDDVKSSNETSFYFLKLKNNSISKKQLIQDINAIDFSNIVNKTAGVKSLSKPEFISALFKR